VGTYNPATKVLTVDESGLYLVTFTLKVEFTTGTSSVATLGKNGTQGLLYSYGAGGTSATDTFQLSAGDTLKVTLGPQTVTDIAGYASGTLSLEKVD
jgi:hypothetical protein